MENTIYLLVVIGIELSFSNTVSIFNLVLCGFFYVNNYNVYFQSWVNLRSNFRLFFVFCLVLLFAMLEDYEFTNIPYLFVRSQESTIYKSYCWLLVLRVWAQQQHNDWPETAQTYSLICVYRLKFCGL